MFISDITMQEKIYDTYPRRIVLISNLNTVIIYAIGASIIFQIGNGRGIAYIIFLIYMEFRLLQKSCRNCRYYGKYCAFGKGKLSALIYPKGKPEKFLNRKITRKNMLPDILLWLIPIITGIILLTQAFNRRIMIGIILLLTLAFQGNSCIRGKFACNHCKQGELGCPAKKLFDKAKNNS